MGRARFIRSFTGFLTQTTTSIWALPALLAGLTAWALYEFQGRFGFSVGDGGFLWYGAQRILAGEVPMRDFMAYDPGRYYWSAGVMLALRDQGILANRLAAALVQAAGLFVVLLLVHHAFARKRPLLLVVATMIFALWMFPWYKQFDFFVSIAMTAALAYLLAQPSPRRSFLAGLSVGIAAVVGRNHGLYGLVAGAAALGYLGLGGHGLARYLRNWLGGILVGYTPVLVMLVLIPGFAYEFWTGIRSILTRGATNIPLPVPWPWLVDFSDRSGLMAVRDVLLGLCFVGLMVFIGVGLVHAARSRLQARTSPVLLASVFMTLPYAHYVLSRADEMHLALGMVPLITGLFATASRAADGLRSAIVAGLLAASVIVMAPMHPGLQARIAGDWVEARIGGSELTVRPRTATVMRIVYGLSERHPGRSFVALPYLPGIYAALDQPAPFWEIYALFPRDSEFEQVEISRMKTARPAFAVIYDTDLDGREDLRFRNTHPETMAYVERDFELREEIPVWRAGTSLQVFEAQPGSVVAD